MEIYDVVKKLLGPITTVGETNTDEKRYANLEATMALVDKLLADINEVAQDKDCQEYSRSKSGKKANQFLSDIMEYLPPTNVAHDHIDATPTVQTMNHECRPDATAKFSNTGGGDTLCQLRDGDNQCQHCGYPVNIVTHDHCPACGVKL